LFNGPWYFGLPADKNGEGIFDPRVHYTWYNINTSERGRHVVYQNQFGENVLTTGNGIYMLVPALKFPQEGELPPIADHFKCYKALGEPLNLTATLQTQFGFETVVLDRPEVFCNPAEKVLPDGQAFPIMNDRDHLVCYRIFPEEPLGTTVTYLDQFLNEFGVVEENRWLCVPSLKTGVTQAEETSWGRLKTIYR
jgi:hypothetical protein